MAREPVGCDDIPPGSSRVKRSKGNSNDMRRKLYPINVLARAKNITVAWEQIGAAVTFGSVTNGVFHEDIMQAGAIETRIKEAELQLAVLRNERDALYLSLWDKVKRVYDSVKGIYGDDSTEYELVGRKRASARKRRSRKFQAG
jgi:hypothetical protein